MRRSGTSETGLRTSTRPSIEKHGSTTVCSAPPPRLNSAPASGAAGRLPPPPPTAGVPRRQAAGPPTGRAASPAAAPSAGRPPAQPPACAQWGDKRGCTCADQMQLQPQLSQWHEREPYAHGHALAGFRKRGASPWEDVDLAQRAPALALKQAQHGCVGEDRGGQQPAQVRVLLPPVRLGVRLRGREPGVAFGSKSGWWTAASGGPGAPAALVPRCAPAGRRMCKGTRRQHAAAGQAHVC